MDKPRDIVPKDSRVTVINTKEEEAQAVFNDILKYSGAIKVYYIHIGQLLKKARDEQQWITLGYEAYWEYLRDLGIEKAAARKMIEVVEYVLTLPFVDGTETPGWTSMVRLLPLAKEGKLTQELWEDAKVLHDSDLRRELGHNVPKLDQDIQCPLCGGTFQIKGGK